MKIVSVVITTRSRNLPYYAVGYPSVLDNRGDFSLHTVVTDFSGHREMALEALVPADHVYTHRPGAGFCSNVNTGMFIALGIGADYFGHVNDDARLPPDFFQNAIKTLEMAPDVGFVGGVQQITDEVCISPERFASWPIQEGVRGARDEIDDLLGRWGDFSAWLVKREVLLAVGELDEAFDPVGIMADNDWIWRIRRAGYRAFRDYGMPYVHAKGVTQRPLRPEWPNDSVGNANAVYFRKKWGTEPREALKEARFADPFGGVQCAL